MTLIKNLNWAGWEIESNIHGKEFDLSARIRMIEGGQKLKPYILKHISLEKNLNILEIGPFFNPLIQPIEFTSSNIYYLEGDENALKWLKRRVCSMASANQTSIAISSNLNSCHKPDFWKSIKNTINPYNINSGKLNFDVIVVSQVLNYVDYRQLLKGISKNISSKGKLFINNVTDYGLPKFFSDKRPKSNKELIQTVSDIGFAQIDKETIHFNLESNELERLLLTCEKIN